MAQKGKKIALLGLEIFLTMLLASQLAFSASSPEPNSQPKSLDYAGIDALKKIDPNLTGQGVKFAVISRSITYENGIPQNDYRPDIDHNCLKNASVQFKDQGVLDPGISPHSTAVCSILFGDDPAGFNDEIGQFSYQGTIPKAQADIYEFWHFLINNVFPQSPPDADVVTASLGSPFEDWWTRGIESLVEQYGLIVVAGIGNGSDSHDPTLYPAAGANVIGVGLVDSVKTNDLSISLTNFSNAYPEHSSCGPDDNGRCKPDIVAPGNCLIADTNDPNSYRPAGSWSSYSTPLVAGTAGLLVQKAKQDPNLTAAISPDAGNCVIKAILLNSATKLPYWHKGLLTKEDDHFAPLDHLQGAGMLNALGAYENLTAGQHKQGNCPVAGWDNNLLHKTENPENIYKIKIDEPAGKYITITATWNRHFENTYPFDAMPEKDMNLVIELWAIDANNPQNDYLLDYSDSFVDNTEHIYHKADANFTNYEIVITYSDANEHEQIDITQRYGLAWNVTADNNSDDPLWYDLNADGIVDENDLSIMIDNMIETLRGPQSYAIGDLNLDSIIDINDLKILTNHLHEKADWNTY